MICVFTPTSRYGGLDVTFASLDRQTVKDFVWIVQDELLSRRIAAYDYAEFNFGFEIIFLQVPFRNENRRNLAASYNKAAETALDLGADYLVSLQDYIWVPENGLEMFLEIHDHVEKSLVTGLTSHSVKPLKSDIVNYTGGYTIFAEPFTQKPEEIGWRDVREVDLYPEEEFKTIKCHPEHWEANWASIDMSIIKGGVRWDEDYDVGVAYENMDFAKRAVQAGATCVLDKRNHAISLPHRSYFEGEEQELKEYSNREMYEQKWLMS